MDRSIQHIRSYSKIIAAVLALFIGMMSILAGSMVLLGIDAKEYNILTWLVSYNVIFGAVSIYAAYLIWRKKEQSKLAVIFILISHSVILLYLLFFENNVALQSVKAMFFRIAIWLIIMVLSILVPIIYSRKTNKL